MYVFLEEFPVQTSSQISKRFFENLDLRKPKRRTPFKRCSQKSGEKKDKTTTKNNKNPHPWFFQVLKLTAAKFTLTSETNVSGFGSLASMQQRSKVKSPPQHPGFPSRLPTKKSQKICETCVFFEEKGWGNFIRNMKTKTVCAELQIAFSDLKNVFCRNKESKANFLTKEMGLN